MISVGSISAGGAGKTPVVIALAKMLRARGWDVDVLSRGYGRTGHGVEWVAALGDRAARTIRRRAGCHCASDGCSGVGEREQVCRGTGGGERCGRPWDAPNANHNHENADGVNQSGVRGVRGVHLLDDGFQHRQLARNFDVALVTAEDLNDTLLPAGNLREGFEALQRADAVVVREDELDDVKARAWKLMREGAQMWVVRRRLVFPAPLFVFSAGLRPVAFCAIARPEGFQAMLREAGCGVVDTIAFPDHHAYGMRGHGAHP